LKRALLGVAVLVAACGGTQATTTTLAESVLQGVLVIDVTSRVDEGDTCDRAGFEDVIEGAPVIVRDEGGDIVGNGNLPAVESVLYWEGPPPLLVCEFRFAVTVPTDREF